MQGSGMAKAMGAGLATALLCVGSLHAQDLPVQQVVEREIAIGAVHSYRIELNTGDYVAGSIDQRGIAVVATVLEPSGSRLRSFSGPAERVRAFAFIADTPGTYRLELRTDTVGVDGRQAEKGSYKLEITEKLSVADRLKPQPRHETYPSPRIKALRAEVARRREATEEFWREIAESGAPIVEPLDGDPDHVLVTFVWRGTPDTQNVGLRGSFVGFGSPMTHVMTHVANTDVWYLTTRLPSGARFTYQLSPNDPLTSDGPAAAQRLATLQADPLNPHRWRCPETATRYECQSMAQLPGASPQPWVVRHSETPAGNIDKHTIESRILNNERTLSVYTPPGYRANSTPFALLVVFDEDAYLSHVPTPVILDNLIAASKIPPLVALFVGNPSQQTRSNELPPNPQFAEFLVKELMPWVRAHYAVTTDPGLTVVAGSSYGGIAATYAGLRHPEIFGNVLCQSGSFWWAPDHKMGQNNEATTETAWLAKEFIRSPKLPLKFWIEAGVFEVDGKGSGGGILETSRHMRDVLLAKGYEVYYRQFVGGHDFLSWRGTFADGLIALIGAER